MSDISKIKVSGVEYDIKDIQARGDLGNLGTRVTELEQHGGGSTVPKPLTYDYMPEGYPKKTVQTTVLMEEQEVAFVENGGKYRGDLAAPYNLVVGQTYTVNWDGTEYECVARFSQGAEANLIGNTSFMGEGEDTGEPFFYYDGAFSTLDTSPTHTISVTTHTEVTTLMAKEFLPAIPIFYAPITGAAEGQPIKLTDADGNAIYFEQAQKAGINVIIEDSAHADGVAQFLPIGMLITKDKVYYSVYGSTGTLNLYAGGHKPQ